MDVAIQLVVQIEVALVLQRRSASGALEAVHMQVLVLDAHKHTTDWTDIVIRTLGGGFGMLHPEHESRDA